MVRRLCVVVALSAVVAALLYTAAPAPSPPSPDAPQVLDRPLLVRAGAAGDEIQIRPDYIVWRSPVSGVPYHVRFSWLECDLDGKRCSPLPGLHGMTIVPPQERR